MSSTALEASQGYRVRNYDQLFCHHGQEATQDNTVLLVCAEGDLENEVLEWPTVRATFQASAVSLMYYHSGHSSVEEDLERAQREPDNVFRG